MMEKLELKIPPVAWVVIFALLMWCASLVTPGWAWSWSVRLAAFAVAFLLAGFIAVGCLLAFRRTRTTLNPMVPEQSSALISDGWYRVSRNPIYLAMLAMLIGLGLLLANPVSLALSAGFVWIMNRLQIHPEERTLQKMFGEDYRAYCQRVRRWL
ncbi:MAG: isoprenylcysteine carboxylmethyltransferase family protein [Reinekea sp.]|nr:isoprenylcysteine carboxylmethyltransferase family protein [Reinekea sp.]